MKVKDIQFADNAEWYALSAHTGMTPTYFKNKFKNNTEKFSIEDAKKIIDFYAGKGLAITFEDFLP